MTACGLGNACELRNNEGEISGPIGVCAPTGPDPADVTNGAVQMIVPPRPDTATEARSPAVDIDPQSQEQLAPACDIVMHFSRRRCQRRAEVAVSTKCDTCSYPQLRLLCMPHLMHFLVERTCWCVKEDRNTTVTVVRTERI